MPPYSKGDIVQVRGVVYPYYTWKTAIVRGFFMSTLGDTLYYSVCVEDGKQTKEACVETHDIREHQ